MVIIKVPDIFQHSADALTNFGYQYRLSKTISPLTDEYTVVDQSTETLADPVAYDFTLGGCNWRETSRKTVSVYYLTWIILNLSMMSMVILSVIRFYCSFHNP